MYSFAVVVLFVCVFFFIRLFGKEWLQGAYLYLSSHFMSSVSLRDIVSFWLSLRFWWALICICCMVCLHVATHTKNKTERSAQIMAKCSIVFTRYNIDIDGIFLYLVLLLLVLLVVVLLFFPILTIDTRFFVLQKHALCVTWAAR